MCGIAGFINFDGSFAESSILDQMVDQMKLRGPDSRGIYTDKNVALGMRRLAIIDQAGGRQPIQNEDGSVVVVCNGEIYNYKELRKDLETRGHKFSTHSDVEVLVHLYEDFGLEAIQRINGMFAFCIWDKKYRKMWIGRDRIGIKPLVYRQTGNEFIFASTADSLLKHPNSNANLSEDACLLYLGLSYIPSPYTIYSEIKKLPPGCFLIIQETGEIKLEKYWDVTNYSSIKLETKDIDEMVLSILKDSIKIESRSDVPVGSSLSGGLDSSSITALYSLQSDLPVHTFSVDFEGKGDSEAEYAKLVANRYNAIHHPILISAKDGWLNLKRILSIIDEPIADSAIVPSYCLSKYARQSEIKVLISGAGGDEIFGGYFRHYKRKRNYLVRNWQAEKFPWLESSAYLFGNKIQNYAFQSINRGINYSTSTSGVNLGFLSKVLDETKFRRLLELLSEHFSNIYKLEKDLGFTLSRMKTDLDYYLADNILALLDKSTMATSVEGRVPLLDHRLVECAFAVGERQQFVKSNPKRLFKRIMAPYVPDEIINRRKLGFNGPINFWLKNLREGNILTDLVVNENPLIGTMFNPKLLLKEVDSFNDDRAVETTYQLLVFNQWYQNHALKV
ncbi:MAG: asparagine synthase (glutamine-hydrolyzing) [Oligoflexales bacterium]